MTAANVDGALVIDKAPGMTSHDVVNRARRILGTSKIGHLGTLDPLAEGVLPLVVGKATRLAPYLGGGEKEYLAVIRFGYSTDTYDREGLTAGDTVTPAFSLERLERELGAFRGAFAQTPPPVSAKKVGGVPAYKLARGGSPPKLDPVNVVVSQIELLDFDLPTARLRLRCSAGTYVRAIAHELGQALGCGAVLDRLRRTAAGAFHEGQSRTLEAVAALAAGGDPRQALIPCAELLPEFPLEIVDEFVANQIRQGRDFRLSPFRSRAEARYVKVFSDAGGFLALGEARAPNLYHPVVVFQETQGIRVNS